MKKLSLLPIAILLFAVSCEKPMSETERNAQVEREVQQRLAAERQTADQDRLAQQQADLETRERALDEKEKASNAKKTVAVATPRPTARREAHSASSDNRSPRSYDTFYRKLEPYGAWRETDNYGYVWQPRTAQQSRNWRPYTDGRWAYTDAGWTWVSDEPFGWATYHYGRWTRLRGVGWVWVPGEEWAPAWVSWRTSDENVGWAPLPPEARFERRTGIKKWADSYYDIDADEYVFIPNEDIGAENVGRSVIPVERNVTIVNQTTNVTNITYNNTTIVNEGPNYDELRSRSRRPVERLRLEREYNIQEDSTPQSTVRGGVLAIMTPLFTARATQRPRNVGAPIQRATTEREATAGQPEAQRARAKMRAEATPPTDAPSKTFEKPVVLEGTPAPVPTATAAPATTPTATAEPTAAPTAAPASTPSATETPRRGPRSTPTPEATPVATATPATTATVAPTATPTATPVPTAVATPAPGVTDPPEKTGEEPPDQTSEAVDGRKPRGAAGEKLRAKDEAKNAKMREAAARMAAPPKPAATPLTAAEPVAPRAVTPPPTAAPDEPAAITEPIEATPMLKEAGRRGGPRGRIPSKPSEAAAPVAESTPLGTATPTPTPTPVAEKAPAADESAAPAEETKPTPEGANEP